MTLPDATPQAVGRVISGEGPLVGARSLRAAGVAGILFAVLFIASLLFLLGRQPPDASPAQLEDWLQEGLERWFIGLQLVPFAGIAFLWFLASIRARIGRREDQFLATVFIGSGLLFVAMYFVGGAAAAAPVTVGLLSQAPANPEAAIIGRAIGYTLYFLYGVKMAAVFILISSTIGLRSGALPRWFCLLGYPTGLLLLLVVNVYEWVIMIFPIWVAITGIILMFAQDPLTDSGGTPPAPEDGAVDDASGSDAV